jgi:hypothetical protein
MNTKSFHDVEIKAADKGQVEATIATIGVLDHDGDVMCDGCLPESKVAISPFGHAIWAASYSSTPVVPLGYGVFKQDDEHLVFSGRYNLDVQAGREAFADVKMALAEGVNTEWSFSLQKIIAENGEIDGQPARFIKSFRPAEVSRVLQGASIGSGTSAVKGATFSEHADTVLAAVDVLAARAAEVVALRAEKGKTISDESAGLLAQLADRLDAIKALLTAEPNPNTPDPDDLAAMVANEYVRSLALIGVTS